MGVTCQILINKPREGVHKAGNLISGAVKYAIDEPTEYKDVTLSLLGKGKCCWKENHGNVVLSYKGTEAYITWHVNMINKKPEENITLHGVYEYPFEFYLPEDIPPSFKESRYKTSSIVYCMQLKFVKSSFFSFNKVFTAEIPVCGLVDVTTSDGVTVPDVPINFGLEKNLFAPFSMKKPVITLNAAMIKACVAPGENAQLSYVVTNQSDVPITSVRAELYCYMTYTANCGRVRNFKSKVKGCKVETPALPKREVSNLTCVVPTLPEQYSIQYSKIIKREYAIRLTVRLPMPYKNVLVEVPVVIGERKGGAEPCVTSDGVLEPQPPSYWEAMCEEKETEKEKENF